MPQHKTVPLDDAWALLSAIDAHDRATWLIICMVLKSYYGDEGWRLFVAWSQTADNYSASDARSVWRSCRGSGYTIGTLYYLAKQNGWRKDAPSTPAPAPPPRRAPKPLKSSTATYAAELWLKANKWMDADDWLSHPSTDELIVAHPYAIAKGITHAGGAGISTASGSKIGRNQDCIIVPIREHGIGKVQAVECISGQAVEDKWPKQTFGPKAGCYLLLGNTLDKSIPWYVVEGWADAYTVVWHWNNRDNSKKDNCVCGVAFGKNES